MDDAGQIGPDKPGYGQDVRSLAEWLDRLAVFVPFAANSTRMNLVLSIAETQVWPFGDPAGLEGDLAQWCYVAVGEHGVYWFNLGSYLAPGYVTSKLGIEAADGEALAEFLTRLGAARRIHAEAKQ